MIVIATGNLLHADAEALVNTVNCEGVMGKGIALQFKQAFPHMFKAYLRASKAGEIVPGKMHIFVNESALSPKFIINFPTKRHWKDKSLIEDIDAGLVDLVAQVRSLGIRSIAIPPLGSGLGGLQWADVHPKIVKAFESLPDLKVLLFSPLGEPLPDQRRTSPTKEKLTTSRALFIRLLDLYRIPNYALTLLEVQKLAYFLQEAGQSLRLEFKKHHYGPYAHNLSHVLQRLEGHYLQGATNTEPSTEISLTSGAIEAASAFLEGDLPAASRLDRVARLIEGFETPYGMELLATVHWIVKESPAAATDPALCIALVHDWNPRKQRVLRPEHIQIAHLALQSQGWFSSVAS